MGNNSRSSSSRNVIGKEGLMELLQLLADSKVGPSATVACVPGGVDQGGEGAGLA